MKTLWLNCLMKNYHVHNKEKKDLLKYMYSVVDNTNLDNWKDHVKKYLSLHNKRFLDILRLLPQRKKLKILSIGIGYGCFESYLRDKLGHNIKGMDVDINPIAKQANFDVAIHDLNLNQPFPFKTEYFDVVIFSEVLEHLRVPPKKPLKEIHRVLKKRGCLILTTPNFANFKNIVGLIRGKTIIPKFDMKYISAIIGSKSKQTHEHLREYTTGELLNVITKTGFKKERVLMSMGWNKMEKISALNILNFLIPKILPRYRDCIMILATKEAN